MDSKFKPIPGYNGYLISEDGVVYSEKTSHFMKIKMLGCYQYPVVSLYVNKLTNVPVHKLVALAWLPIPQNWSLNEVLGNYESKCLVVHHKDNNKMNYKASNLEWVTQYENLNKDELNKLRSEKMKGNKNAKGHHHSSNTHKKYKYFLNGQEMTIKELTEFLKCSKSKITESFRRNLGLVRTGMLTREEK